jgi:hypothetical protein
MRALTEIEAAGFAGPELASALGAVSAPAAARRPACRPGAALVKTGQVIELERGSSPCLPRGPVEAAPPASRTRRPAVEGRLCASSPSVGVPLGAARRPVTAPESGISVQTAPLRLTRRGRAVVGGLIITALTVAALLVSLIASGGAQATNHGRPGAGYQGMREVVVQPGETLWSIASAADPNADPRSVVEQIMSVNDLTGTNLSVGEELWVPR